jgi:hypothetical protein
MLTGRYSAIQGIPLEVSSSRQVSSDWRNDVNRSKPMHATVTLHRRHRAKDKT